MQTDVELREAAAEAGVAVEVALTDGGAFVAVANTN